MLLLSNAKINLGLRIVAKRTDGYHDIETVMIPVGLTDIIEFVETSGKEIFTTTGIVPECSTEQNLLIRALRLIQKDFRLPELNIHLHKCIPPGAGLGGGSSNAAFMLKGLNDYFELGISDDRIKRYASVLGSDCPVFILNKPSLALGKGDVLKTIAFPYSFYLVLIYPGFSISTKEAYSNVILGGETIPLSEVIKKNSLTWKNSLINEFEKTIFIKYPELNIIKSLLYEHGAVYASMSGSGPVLYGLFNSKPTLDSELEKMKLWEGQIGYPQNNK